MAVPHYDLTDAFDELDISGIAEEAVDSNESDEWRYESPDDEYVLQSTKFSIPKKIFNKLYPHQKEGVAWLSNLYQRSMGGILGDDMGMGKTFQTLTYLGGLMFNKEIRNAIVICPVSILRNWESEAKQILKCCVPDVNIVVVTSQLSQNKRNDLLEDAISCCENLPHFVIVTYGLVSSNPSAIIPDGYFGEKNYWDFVILDEGHQIKNRKTKKHQGCATICKRGKTRRLLLTGTPIQNNLEELWSLFDWATEGRLLGDLLRFKNQFAFPIQEGRHKGASDEEIKSASKANKELQRVIQQNFLQRLKKDTFSENPEDKNSLPKKQDLVVWTHLSEKQRSLYEKYLQEDNNVRSVISGETKSPLIAITWLKKLCGHPYLCRPDEYDTFFDDDEDVMTNESAKLQALKSLVDELLSRKHRMLIFSQSTKMLDIIQHVLNPISAFRIDGSTKERDRQQIVNSFNKNTCEIDVLLLSTKAGGLGLTLTGADTAIVYDPSWNPAEDSQAVDRCYRIGQKKDVTIYRLITAGTVEERMYERQIFKDGIRRTVLTSSGCATERHFHKHDLKKLFTLGPVGVCEMLDKVSSEADGICEEFSSLKSHSSILGITPHGAMYTNIMNNVDENSKQPLFNGKWHTKASGLGYSNGISPGRSSDDDKPYAVKGKSGKIMQYFNTSNHDEAVLIEKGKNNKTRMAREDAKFKFTTLKAQGSDSDDSLYNYGKENRKPNYFRKSIVDLCDSSESEVSDVDQGDDESEGEVEIQGTASKKESVFEKDTSYSTSEAEFTLSSDQSIEEESEGDEENSTDSDEDNDSERNLSVDLNTNEIVTGLTQIEIGEEIDEHKREMHSELLGQECESSSETEFVSSNKESNEIEKNDDGDDEKVSNSFNDDLATAVGKDETCLDDTFILKSSFDSSSSEDEEGTNCSVNVDEKELVLDNIFIPTDEVPSSTNEKAINESAQNYNKNNDNECISYEKECNRECANDLKESEIGKKNNELITPKSPESRLSENEYETGGVSETEFTLSNDNKADDICDNDLANGDSKTMNNDVSDDEINLDDTFILKDSFHSSSSEDELCDNSICKNLDGTEPLLCDKCIPNGVFHSEKGDNKNIKNMKKNNDLTGKSKGNGDYDVENTGNDEGYNGDTDFEGLSDEKRVGADICSNSISIKKEISVSQTILKSPPNEKDNITRTSASSSSASKLNDSVISFDGRMKGASELKKQGENQQAMSLLLDQLDNIEDIKKDQKLKLHKEIALTARELQWL